MSVPNSMRVGPYAPTILVKKSYLLFYIFLVWVSVIAVLLEFWWYWQILYYQQTPILFYVFLPLVCLGFYFTMVFTSLLFAKLLLIIVNAIHKPSEGVFLRDKLDKDYRYWCIRNVIKRWPIWLSHHFPFPFLDNICFKMFGVKTKFSNSLFEGFVDTEFIEFGDNVVIGQGAIVQSTVIIGDFVIVRKTTIGNDVLLATHSVVMPGTHIGNRCILTTNSCTTVGQVLEDGWIYLGIPAEKFKQNRYFEEGLEEKLGYISDLNSLREKYEKSVLKNFHEHHTLLERRQQKKEIIEQEKQIKEQTRNI